MWDRDPSNRILLPTHQDTKLEHEAEAATSIGAAHERDIDAISIFAIHPLMDAGSGVVIAVADAEDRTPTATLAAAIAVDAFEDEFTEQTAGLALGGGGWQESVATAIASAFAHANANVQRTLGDTGSASGHGIALTTIAVCGDWICVAHAGDGRAYRFSRQRLELLTAEHDLQRRNAAATLSPVCRPLGYLQAPAPVISFHRVRSDDLLLVCSHAIGQRLDVADFAQLLGSRHSVADLARRLVSAAVARGSEGDLRAIVLRVGRLRGRRLPAPTDRPATYDHGDPPLLRSPARGTRTAAPRRVGRVLALGLLMAGLGGAGWYWQTTAAAEASMQSVETMLQRQQLATRLPSPEQAEAPAAPAPTLVVTTPEPPPASVLSDDSSARLADERIRQRDRRAAAVAEGRRLAALQQTQDSQAVADDAARSQQLVLAAAATDALIQRAAAEKQARDSSAALRESRALAQLELERRAAQRRADQLAAAALAESSTVSAAAAERLATETLANGQLALKTWLSGLVSQANAGNLSAPVLASGPSSFASFIRKQHPTLSEAHLLTNSVTGTTGEATAQWLAKWRTSFGTGGSRRMQATASVVLENGSWRVRDWRITEGAP